MIIAADNFRQWLESIYSRRFNETWAAPTILDIKSALAVNMIKVPDL